jgi:hypothetical protein
MVVSKVPDKPQQARRLAVAPILAQVRAWRAQGEAIELQLAELADADTGEPPEWVGGDEARALTGIRKSTGADIDRPLKDWARARGVESVKAGRSTVWRRSSLLAALEASAKRPSPKPVAAAPPVPVDDAAEALAAAGLRVVSSSRTGTG